MPILRDRDHKDLVIDHWSISPAGASVLVGSDRFILMWSSF
jgi:hypothetical protein